MNTSGCGPQAILDANLAEEGTYGWVPDPSNLDCFMFGNSEDEEVIGAMAKTYLALVAYHQH